MEIRPIATFTTNDMDLVDTITKDANDYVEAALKAGYKKEQITITPLMDAGRYNHAFNFIIVVVIL